LKRQEKSVIARGALLNLCLSLKCYWFTLEFGLCRQEGKLRAFGGGLLSSFGELEYCLSDRAVTKPFDPPKTALAKYSITQYQSVYYVSDSFDDAKQKLLYKIFEHV
jgi:phenylalanine-4-hydroxylase